MLERLLTLAVVIKPELVHGAVTDRPSVSYVPLLKAFCQNAAEAGYVGTRKLEIRKRLVRRIVIEIVVDTQVLFVIEPVVDLDGELVATYSFGGNGTDQ